MGGIFRRKKSPPPPPPPPPAPPPAAAPSSSTGAAKGGDMSDTDLQTSSEASTGAGMRRKRRGKRSLVNQPAAANVGGSGESGIGGTGATGLNIPTG